MYDNGLSHSDALTATQMEVESCPGNGNTMASYGNIGFTSNAGCKGSR